MTAPTDTDDALDSWGFTAADHAALRTLMKKYRHRIHAVLAAMMRERVTPVWDDEHLQDWLDRRAPMPCVFPAGGFWRAFLQQLQALDR